MKTCMNQPGRGLKIVYGLFALALLAGLSLMVRQAVGAGQAQAVSLSDYPAKPVTLIVTFPPGGGTDLLARKLAATMERALGQPWIVENRPGASGNIGARLVSGAAPDAYTLLMVNSSFAINPGVFSQLEFNPKQDFSAVVNVAYVPSVLVTATDSDLLSMEHVMDQSRATQGLHFASCGNGTPQHLAGGMLQGMGAKGLSHVPYKGCGPALNDVLAGQVPLGIITLSSATPLIESGALRALAVTSPERHPALPDVPSVAEVLKTDYQLDQWHGILAPAGTPKALINRLNQTINHALEQSDMQADLQAWAYTVDIQSPEQFQQEIWSDIDRFSALSTQMGLRVN